MGVKITVDQPMLLTSIRYYKSSQETGLHTGKIWSSTGTQLASVDFANETTSGWQEQQLATPLSLDANTTYVISVNANAVFAKTTSGLASEIVSGPLRSIAGGPNGVFGSAAGVFPTNSYQSSNYFVDPVVTTVGTPTAPTLTQGARKRRDRRGAELRRHGRLLAGHGRDHHHAGRRFRLEKPDGSARTRHGLVRPGDQRGEDHAGLAARLRHDLHRTPDERGDCGRRCAARRSGHVDIHDDRRALGADRRRQVTG